VKHTTVLMRSPKTHNVVISENARHDLQDIAQYTFANHGKAQARKYLNAIESKFILISDNPDIGHAHSDLPHGCKTLLAEKHLIVYKKEEKTVYILRILHQRMNYKDQSVENEY